MTDMRSTGNRNVSEITIRKYRGGDKAKVEHMFNDFEDFLASVDNLERLVRKRLLVKRGYGAAYLKKTLKDVSKGSGFFMSLK